MKRVVELVLIHHIHYETLKRESFLLFLNKHFLLHLVTVLHMIIDNSLHFYLKITTATKNFHFPRFCLTNADIVADCSTALQVGRIRNYYAKTNSTWYSCSLNLADWSHLTNCASHRGACCDTPKDSFLWCH